MQSKEKPKLGKGPMTASEAVRIVEYAKTDPIIGPMIERMLSKDDQKKES